MLCADATLWLPPIQNEIDGMFTERQALVCVAESELTTEQMAYACKLTWVFKIKMKFGDITGRRARLCAQGFSQILGVNFNRTHARLLRMTRFFSY